MNKQISTVFALVVIIIIASAFGFFMWKAGVDEPTPAVVNQTKKASNDSASDQSKIPTDKTNPDEIKAISNWQLVSGDPSDTCTTPTFKGEATVKGWYVYEDVYVEQKDWVFNVVKGDASKLPQIYDAYNKKYLNIEKFRISDASPALQASLKKYTKENPGEVTIKSYSLYCEGLPSASVESPVENQSSVIYKNTQYGFQITLPDEWKNFKVEIDDKQVAITGAVYIHFLIPTTDKNFPDKYADVFAISVWNKSEWNKQINSSECKNNPTPDCPFKESMLGFTNDYVFSVSTGNGIVPNDLLKKLADLFVTGKTQGIGPFAQKTLKFQLID